jgi:hypothetical protein
MVGGHPTEALRTHNLWADILGKHHAELEKAGLLTWHRRGLTFDSSGRDIVENVPESPHDYTLPLLPQIHIPDRTPDSPADTGLIEQNLTDAVAEEQLAEYMREQEALRRQLVQNPDLTQGRDIAESIGDRHPPGSLMHGVIMAIGYGLGFLHGRNFSGRNKDTDAETPPVYDFRGKKVTNTNVSSIGRQNDLNIDVSSPGLGLTRHMMGEVVSDVMGDNPYRMSRFGDISQRRLNRIDLSGNLDNS